MVKRLVLGLFTLTLFLYLYHLVYFWTIGLWMHQTTIIKFSCDTLKFQKNLAYLGKWRMGVVKKCVH